MSWFELKGFLNKQIKETKKIIFSFYFFQQRSVLLPVASSCSTKQLMTVWRRRCGAQKGHVDIRSCRLLLVSLHSFIWQQVWKTKRAPPIFRCGAAALCWVEVKHPEELQDHMHRSQQQHERVCASGVVAAITITAMLRPASISNLRRLSQLSTFIQVILSGWLMEAVSETSYLHGFIPPLGPLWVLLMGLQRFIIYVTPPDTRALDQTQSWAPVPVPPLSRSLSLNSKYIWHMVSTSPAFLIINSSLL